MKKKGQIKKKIKKVSYNTLHKLLTKLLRRFWTYCPKCHEYFAGYHKFATNLICDDGCGQSVNYRIVCHRCYKEHLKVASHKHIEHK